MLNAPLKLKKTVSSSFVKTTVFSGNKVYRHSEMSDTAIVTNSVNK